MIGLIIIIFTILLIGYLIIFIFDESIRSESIVDHTGILAHEKRYNNTSNISGCTHVVSRVIDGDTAILNDGTRLRFANIDAYESNSPIHNEIMRFLVPLIQNKPVRVEFMDTDKYGRRVGNIYLSNGVNVNKLLVEKGYARVYDQYCDKNSDEYLALKAAENRAMQYMIGGFALGLEAPSISRHSGN